MKKKGYLISFALLLLVGFTAFTVYNKTKIHSQNSEDTTRENQVIAKESIASSKKKSNRSKAESYSIDLKNVDAEKLYKAFKGPNTDSIIALLEMDKVDSDRVLVTTDGTIITGKIGIDEDGTEVDSNTDKNSITVKELRDLLLEHKQKIDELSAQNSPIE